MLFQETEGGAKMLQNREMPLHKRSKRLASDAAAFLFSFGLCFIDCFCYLAMIVPSLLNT